LAFNVTFKRLRVLIEILIREVYFGADTFKDERNTIKENSVEEFKKRNKKFFLSDEFKL